MTTQLSFTTLDVFTTTRYEGNPLAVVHIPSNLEKQPTTEQLDQIAKEFNLSETIFIFLNDEAKAGKQDKVPEWKVRIFTTEGEIPFAGHPTIGAAVHALTTLHPSASSSASTLSGKLLAPAGPINIDLDTASKAASANIPHNVHIHTQNPPSLQDVYKLQPNLETLFRPSNVSDVVKLVSTVKGMTFFHVELPDEQSLSMTAITATRPDDLARMDQEWNEGLVGAYFYTFTAESSISASTNGTEEVEHLQVQSRMFMAGLEDPATGSAACGLAALLALTKAKCRVVDVEVVQGVKMGRKSVIGVRVKLNEKRDAVEKIELRGSAVRVMQGTLEI